MFQLNNDKDGRPLVVFLGLTTVAQKGAGRDIVHEFSSHVDRPLVVVEHEGAGKSGVPDKGWNKDITLKAMGESRLRVLDELARQQGKEDFGDFDVAGYSLGGSVALATAEAAGERAHQVVTIQTEGFDDNDPAALRQRAKGLVRDAKTYKDRVEPEIIDRNKQAKGLGEKPPKTSFLGKLRGLRGQAKVALTGSQSAQAATELAPTTRWTTIVGSQDALTDWRGHLGAVRDRNSYAGHSSDVLVLSGDTHYSMKERRAEMAEMVAQVVERKDR
jgi:pimeloyl-ACP methyl ester carboxylesterase